MSASDIENSTTAAADKGPRRSPSMPPVHPWAWRGPLGEAVCRVAPATEADPVAILATSAALFGAIAGPHAYIRLGGVQHPPAIWPLVIGRTGAGRKGTSLAEAKAIARTWGPYAESYIRHRLPSGLSSGEGLLEALGAGDKPDNPDQEPTAPDGRLTVVETEFARVLAAAKREGNTLGPVLRQLWDEGSAGVMTRSRPLQVDGAHIAVIAHVTPRELRLRLAEADLAGGTANRYLMIASERPHLLPHEPPRPELGELGRWLRDALDRARAIGGEVRRDREAEALWPKVYAALAADEPDGIVGQVLARGPAYVMRLGLVFALADGSSSLSMPHLLTGLALWQYSTASVLRAFGDAQRQSADRRLDQALAGAADGLTRTDLYRLFGGTLRADELESMLLQRVRAGRVVVGADESTGGRRASRYRWVGGSLDPVWRILDEHW